MLFRSIILMFYTTGLRVSELQGLCDKDVLMDEEVLKIVGKRGKHRLIPFGKELKDAILHYLEVRDSIYERNGNFFLGARGQAALTSARKNLAYTTVTAPSDGVVGTIPNREGSLASPSSAQPLTTISDNSEVYAYFSFTESDLLDLSNGGTTSLDEGIKAMPEVEFELSSGTRYPLKGRVATVSGLIDNATGAASARALFDNPSGMLRSGNTGKVWQY